MVFIKLLLCGIIFRSFYATKISSLSPFVKFHWKQLDYDLGTGKSSVGNAAFIAENNVPFGIEIWQNKLFVTIPRRRAGIPATLTYINLGNAEKSPLLKPYPNVETNQLSGRAGALVSIYRMNVDSCNRLWFVDTGSAVVGNGTNVQYQPATLKIISLTENIIVKEHVLQQDTRFDSSLTNLIVDVTNSCDDAFAYITDLGGYGLVSFSLRRSESWRIRHPYFYPDPLSCDYNIGGVNFQWQDGVFGAALSSIKPTGNRILYFHPLSTTNEYAVPTNYLQDRTLANSSYHAYKVLGSRGVLSQASASAFHEKTGVLFYPLVNKNSIGCWSERKFPNEHSSATNEIIFKDDVLLLYASDLRVDKEDNLWFISNRLPLSIFSTLNFQQFNFHIFQVPIKTAIEYTRCDPNTPKHGAALSSHSSLYFPTSSLVETSKFSR